MDWAKLLIRIKPLVVPVCTVCAVSTRSYAATLCGLLPLSEDVRNSRQCTTAAVSNEQIMCYSRFTAALFTRAATSAHACMSWSKERASPTITSSASMAA